MVDAIILMHIRHYFVTVCKKISQYLDFRKALLYMRTQYARGPFHSYSEPSLDKLFFFFHFPFCNPQVRRRK